jgi:TonB family protein
MEVEKKAKIYGIIGTVLFQIVLFLILWFFTLSRVVPEEEEGLSVIGIDQEGGSDFFEPTPASQIDGMLASAPESVEPSGSDEFLTQDIEESISLPDEKSEEKRKREQEQRERERQQELEKQEQLRKEAEARALKEAQDRKAQDIRNRTKNVWNNSESIADGVGNHDGSSGTGGGNAQSSKGNPGGGDNSGYSLTGRTLVGGELVKPRYTANEEGRIRVRITVDKKGSVIQATIAPGTNIDNKTLRNAALDAAKKTKFNSISSDSNQSGEITYIFKLE